MLRRGISSSSQSTETNSSVFQPQSNTNFNSSSAWFQVLNQYPNVQVILIDDEELYFRDSPLEDWYHKGQWRDSRWRVQHMSDYIRILSLYKEGGMYLDLDVLTLKPYKRDIFFNFVTAKREHFEQNALGVFRTKHVFEFSFWFAHWGRRCGMTLFRKTQNECNIG